MTYIKRIKNYNKLRKFLRRHWKISIQKEKKDEHRSRILPTPPVIGYKLHRNVNECLEPNKLARQTFISKYVCKIITK